MHHAHYGTLLSVLLGSLILSKVWAATGGDDARTTVATSHASIKAYHNAVISLKDPKVGTMFYVESNGRRLVAFDKDGKVIWNVDVIEAMKGAPAVGAPVIRDLKLDKGRLFVTIAKHSFVEAQPDSGKLTFFGSD